MTTLTCPKCRLGVPDDALDAGQCPACGFPLDGPLVLGPPEAGRRGKRLLRAAGVVAVLTGAGLGGYAFFAQPVPPVEVAHRNGGKPDATSDPVTPVAPFPHESREPTPPSAVTPTPVEPGPEPVGVEPARKEPRPVGVVMKVDPKIAANRHFDQPDDTAALPDLNSGDHVVLTGRLRGLRIGSVNGTGSVDASGLVVEEVAVTGDLNGEAVVKLNAPNGKVTVGGYVGGTARLAVDAPGGAVEVADSGRITGGCAVTVTARRFEAAGPLSGGSRVNATLTRGGSLKFRLMEEGATLTFRRLVPTDPAVSVEQGKLTGGAKLLRE